MEYTLHKHISKQRNKTEFNEKLLNSLHVVDLNTGANPISDAKQFYDMAKNCLHDSGFNLRKFKSNSKILEKIVYQDYPDDEMYSGD